MIPREQHGVLQNERTHSVPPCHFGIAEYAMYRVTQISLPSWE